jgi:hypothetical protein
MASLGKRVLDRRNEREFELGPLRDLLILARVGGGGECGDRQVAAGTGSGGC